MKNNLILLLFALLFFPVTLFSQDNNFELKASQSMLMTGKGEGQDGAKNPFYGQDCYAIVKNIGTKKFSIRIQLKGKIIKTIPILKGEIKKIKLLKDQELYLDSNSKSKIKASLDFKEIKDR